MSDPELMNAVKETCGAALAAFAPSSSVPVEFWAALTANESGANIARGEPIETIRRREPAVFAHLAMVAAGIKPRFGSLTALDFDQPEDQTLPRPISCHEQPLRHASSLLPAADHPQDKASVTVDDLLGWSTSWGWTQLMGYHVLEWKTPLADLVNPEKHYFLAARLMAGFTERFNLDPGKDFEAMARCWNTGRPDGVTFDLHYVQNLLRRIEVWMGL